MMRFAIGQIVRSLVTAQGLTSNERYVVTGASEMTTAFGSFVTYALNRIAVDPTAIPVVNGHLVLTDDASQPTVAPSAKLPRTARQISADTQRKHAGVPASRDPAALKRYATKARVKKGLLSGSMLSTEALVTMVKGGWEEKVAADWIDEALANSTPAAEIVPVAMDPAEEKAGRALAAQIAIPAEAYVEAKAVVVTSEGATEPLPVAEAMAVAAKAVGLAPAESTEADLLTFIANNPDLKAGAIIKAFGGAFALNRVKAALARVAADRKAGTPAPVEEQAGLAPKAEPTVVLDEQPASAPKTTAGDERKAKAAAARAKLAAIN